MTTKRRDLIRQAARDGEDAFWRAVAVAFPGATTGDLPPGVASTFAQQCHRAADAWVDANLPKKPKFLVLRFDVTGWTDAQIAAVSFEATVQGEASEDHPDAEVTASVEVRL